MVVEVVQLAAAIGNYDSTADTVGGEQIEIIAASIRSANHVTQAALMGADIATVPFGILKKCVSHPLTDRGGMPSSASTRVAARPSTMVGIFTTTLGAKRSRGLGLTVRAAHDLDEIPLCL